MWRTSQVTIVQSHVLHLFCLYINHEQIRISVASSRKIFEILLCNDIRLMFCPSTHGCSPICPSNNQTHHDNLHPLSDWVRLVDLLFLQHTSEVAQLPDRAALTTFPGQLQNKLRTFLRSTTTLTGLFSHLFSYSVAVVWTWLPPGPGRRKQGRRSWRPGSWPGRTCSQNSTLSPAEERLQDEKITLIRHSPLTRLQQKGQTWACPRL